MNESFVVCGRTYGPGSILVIAEIGTGHGGDKAKARELIAAAAETGADCAKFQCVFADEIVHPETGVVPLPGGNIRIYDRFKSLEADEDFYRFLKEECERRGILFLCTPFGIGSARLLKRIGAGFYKVASPELNHLPLLDELKSYGSPLILSSGVSLLGDIERAIARTSLGAGCLALLHCVTAYPAPEEDYNVQILPSLGRLFGMPIGVSDHSMDPVIVPALSVAVGGVIVEKHICLRRSDEGLDDPIALTPSDFATMVRALRLAQSRPSRETIADLQSSYGREKVKAVLGDGVKRLAHSEARNYGKTNRSIHALRPIRKGEILSEDKLALLRTEKMLRPGLPPELWAVAIGRRAARDIPAGEGIEWDDLGSPA